MSELTASIESSAIGSSAQSRGQNATPLSMCSAICLCNWSN